MLLDAAIVAATLAGSLAQLSHGGLAGSQTGPGELDWTGAILVACASAPLLVWRQAPRAVFVASGSATVLLGGLGYAIPLPLGATAALYLFAASRDDDDAWTRRSSGAVAGVFLGYLAATALAESRFPGNELLHAGLAWAVAWFGGERTRLRREHLAELRERAARAEREGERERRLAVAVERARIARDLHDAAGHAINVIAVRAGTARLRGDPERSQAALAAIEDLARKMVAEIDHIVGALRERGTSNGAAEAPPGLASLDTLVAQQAAAGLDVSVTTEGRARELEGSVDRAAYRIIQEALTNAARHGVGPAQLKLAFGAGELELTITNAAPGEGARTSNGGHGLIGMQERAALLGGSLCVRRADGAFCVRARLPYGAPDG